MTPSPPPLPRRHSLWTGPYWHLMIFFRWKSESNANDNWSSSEIITTQQCTGNTLPICRSMSGNFSGEYKILRNIFFTFFLHFFLLGFNAGSQYRRFERCGHQLENVDFSQAKNKSWWRNLLKVSMYSRVPNMNLIYSQKDFLFLPNKS